VSRLVKMPTIKKKRKLDRREDRTRAKADAVFLTYVQLGENRTLAKLGEFVRSMGVKVSDKTLERWSSRYGWQERLLQYQAELEKRRALEGVDALEDMDRRHIQLNQALGSLAAAGIKHYQGVIKEAQAKGKKGIKLDISEIVGLVGQAQRGERLARGLATSKAEVIVEVVAPLVKEIMAVFLAVNVITNDPAEIVSKRQAEFIKRGDSILATYYNPTVKNLTTGRGGV
jgi:hypothetical protein